MIYLSVLAVAYLVFIWFMCRTCSFAKRKDREWVEAMKELEDNPEQVVQ